VAPSRRSPISGLSASGRNRTRAKLAFTAAKKGAVGALTLIVGRRLSSSADAGLTEIKLKIELQATAQRISDEDVNPPGCVPRVMGLLVSFASNFVRPSFH
jgi:hypothetical protein